MAETPASLFNESPGSPPPADRSPADRSRRYTRILLILFLCTLPLVNSIVHGDGVGYYAYVRASLIQHNLRFEEDWRHANLNFSQSRTMPSGELLPSQYTETGYVSNQFTVGPALLWASLFTVFCPCFSLILSPENMWRLTGPFSPHLAFGARARSPCICISIQRGPTRNPPLPWPFFSGIGIARGGGARSSSGPSRFRGGPGLICMTLLPIFWRRSRGSFDMYPVVQPSVC